MQQVYFLTSRLLSRVPLVNTYNVIDRYMQLILQTKSAARSWYQQLSELTRPV